MPFKPPRVGDFLASGSIPKPPLKQDAYELDEHILWEFADRTDEGVPYGLLENYLTDLCYVPTIDVNVLRFLLPSALQMWSESLFGIAEAAAGTGEFYAARYRKSESIRFALSERDTAAAVQFMTQTLLAYVESRTTLDEPNLGWIAHWVGAACGLPELATSWLSALEEFDSSSMTLSYLGYVSRIAYRPDANPLFMATYAGYEPWSREVYITGGFHWREVSLAAASIHLQGGHVRPCLQRLIQSASASEMARLVAADMLTRMDVFESRVPEVIAKLEAPEPSSFWSDAFLP